jgi:myo-inositol-1(or 4)-monophosphatase
VNDAPARSAADAHEADALLAIAVEAARSAGALLLERVSRGVERGVTSKSTPTDLVSEADLASEHAIRELLAARRPTDGFVGEEGDHAEGTSGHSWVVDPLDGTVNFLFGIPQWCVSVAVRDGDGTIAGAVYDPNRDELFSATRGGPATLADADGEVELSGSDRDDDLSKAMLATGFAYDRHGCSRAWFHVCATCAASAAPRSTSRGPPPGATTATSSAPSSNGTSPPAR